MFVYLLVLAIVIGFPLSAFPQFVDKAVCRGAQRDEALSNVILAKSRDA